MTRRVLLLLLLPACWFAAGCRAAAPTLRSGAVEVGTGWARSSVNAVIFRSYSLFTHGRTQYIAWYDDAGRLLLGKRQLGSEHWVVRATPYTGRVQDAHNAISIVVDGTGVLHVAWDHHGQPLNYARATAPGSLELTRRLPMTGAREEEVTYPQFAALPDGGLLFLYRAGGSGRGDVLLDRYDPASQTWKAVAHPLLAGEGVRNAYPNPLIVDARGGWHLSWTWRETPDVATNHDVLYAFSADHGSTWRDAAGQPYRKPITAGAAEPALAVPAGSGLMNQTSMAVNGAGRPLIATYWRPAGSAVPQYQLVWFDGSRWRHGQIGTRRAPFRLEGTGTRRIPFSRPLVLAGAGAEVYVVFRDDERGGGVTVACSTDPAHVHWRFRAVDERAAGMWEPTHDPVVWTRDGRLHLFYQVVGQGDAETLDNLPAQPVSVLEWRPTCSSEASVDSPAPF